MQGAVGKQRTGSKFVIIPIIFGGLLLVCFCFPVGQGVVRETDL